ncbi:zinc finger and BTB domain-containing protein 8B isoform 2-T2 [Cyanocitta cristata]
MEVQSYYTKLLGELNEQRKRDFFCDCSIIVEGRIFKAHKNILFANSGYFRALLIHYIQDSGRHSTASLDIVTSEAFSVILDFLYSGKLDLCGENVIEVMSAASYLQMTDVVNFCKTYIRSSLDICRKIEREAAFYQADSGSSAREGTSLGPKSSAPVSCLQEKERIPQCQREPPCGDCSSCHPLELVVRDPLSSDCPDDPSLPKGVEPKVEFDPDEVEVGERLPQFPTPLSLEQMEEGQPVELACNNYHMKQFLEALLRNSSAQRKEDVVHHFVRGFEGRAEDAGVAVSSMMDIHSDWYGEDTGERTRGVQPVELRREQLCWASSFVTLVEEYIAEYFWHSEINSCCALEKQLYSFVRCSPWEVTCWWCPSSCTSAPSAPTRPSRRGSSSATSAPTPGRGPIPARPAGSASPARSTCGATRSASIAPTSPSSARAAGEPSPTACPRGCGASGSATAAPVSPPPTRTPCPSTSASWKQPQKARKKGMLTTIGPSTWSLERKMRRLMMMMAMTSRKSTGVCQTGKL